ncbi:hypothetical protein ACJX0J_023017 [Zea mays]
MTNKSYFRVHDRSIKYEQHLKLNYSPEKNIQGGQFKYEQRYSEFKGANSTKKHTLGLYFVFFSLFSIVYSSNSMLVPLFFEKGFNAKIILLLFKYIMVCLFFSLSLLKLSPDVAYMLTNAALGQIHFHFFFRAGLVDRKMDEDDQRTCFNQYVLAHVIIWASRRLAH